MITKQVIILLLIMLIGTDAGLVGLPVGGNLEYQEETHLSDLVTT